MASEAMFDLCLSQLPVAGWEAGSRHRGREEGGGCVVTHGGGTGQRLSRREQAGPPEGASRWG